MPTNSELNWRAPLTDAIEEHREEFEIALSRHVPVRVMPDVHDAYVRSLLTPLCGQFQVEAFAPDLDWVRPAMEPSRSHGFGVDLPRRLRELRDSLLSPRRGDAPRLPELLWIRGSGTLGDASPGHMATVALLRDIAERIYYGDTTVSRTRILVTGQLVALERHLGHLVEELRLARPSGAMLRGMIKGLLAAREKSSDDDQTSEVAELLRGLEPEAAAHVIRIACDDQRPLSVAVSALRNQHLKQARSISVITDGVRDKEVGGLRGYRAWLDSKTEILWAREDARAHGIRLPQGILLAGVPGCGKSLAAKLTATVLKLPLLQLEIGKLFGKHLGESEAGLAEALAIAESAAPCVLWIDEIEKALPVAKGVHEVTMRLVGILLTWLQERPRSARDILVVATANLVDDLPPELLRRGRFDEFFYFDYPTSEERMSVAEATVARVNGEVVAAVDGRSSSVRPVVWKLHAEIEPLADLEGSWSGADLEALVRAAMEKCFAKGRDASDDGAVTITREDLRDAAARFNRKEDSAQKEDFAKRISKLKAIGFRNASEPLPSDHQQERRHHHRLPLQLQALFARGRRLTFPILTEAYGKQLLVLSPDRFTAMLTTAPGQEGSYRIRIDRGQGDLFCVRLIRQAGDSNRALPPELVMSVNGEQLLISQEGDAPIVIDAFSTSGRFALRVDGKPDVVFAWTALDVEGKRGIGRVDIGDDAYWFLVERTSILSSDSGFGLFIFEPGVSSHYWMIANPGNASSLERRLADYHISFPILLRDDGVLKCKGPKTTYRLVRLSGAPQREPVTDTPQPRSPTSP